jgi:hypothetical protein
MMPQRSPHLRRNADQLQRQTRPALKITFQPRLTSITGREEVCDRLDIRSKTTANISNL